MALVAQKTDLKDNGGAGTILDLDIADVGTDRFMVVWEVRIVWNTSGTVTRVHLLDGITETDFASTYDTGANVNPRILAWLLPNPPSKVDSGAIVRVTMAGADKRIIAIGENLSGVDLAEAVGPFTHNNDQTNTQDRTNLTADPAANCGAFLDCVAGLRGGSLTKPDYSPITAGLAELEDSDPFPGSVFFGAAAGQKDAEAVATSLSWLISVLTDTAWNHAAFQLVQAEIVDPPVQAVTLKAVDTQAITLKEA